MVAAMTEVSSLPLYYCAAESSLGAQSRRWQTGGEQASTVKASIVLFGRFERAVRGWGSLIAGRHWCPSPRLMPTLS